MNDLPKLITTGMPGSLRTKSPAIWNEWVRRTGCVSVTIPTQIPANRIEVHKQNYATICKEGKAAGASAIVINWGPWNQFGNLGQDTSRPAGEFVAVTNGFSQLSLQEAAYWCVMLKHAADAAKDAGLKIIGTMDSELWSTTTTAACYLRILYREAERWWASICGAAPCYWYGLGDVRRQRRADGAIVDEPATRFPLGYESTQEGRAAPVYYHLGDPAECLWRIEAAKRYRDSQFPNGTLPYGAWLSLSSSSTDGRALTTDEWPVKYTACVGEYLGQQIADGWVDRVILWMKSTDWTSDPQLRHLAALCGGL